MRDYSLQYVFETQIGALRVDCVHILRDVVDGEIFQIHSLRLFRHCRKTVEDVKAKGVVPYVYIHHDSPPHRCCFVTEVWKKAGTVQISGCRMSLAGLTGIVAQQNTALQGRIEDRNVAYSNAD